MTRRWMRGRELKNNVASTSTRPGRTLRTPRSTRARGAVEDSPETAVHGQPLYTCVFSTRSSDSAVNAPLRDDMSRQRVFDDAMRLRWRNTELRRFDGAVPMVDANTIVCDARALVLLHDAGALAAGEMHATHVKADG